MGWVKKAKGRTPLEEINDIIAETTVGGVIPPAAIFILGAPGSARPLIVQSLARAAKDMGVIMPVSTDVNPYKANAIDLHLGSPGGCCDSQLANPITGVGLDAAKIAVIACWTGIYQEWEEALAAAGFKGAEGLYARAQKLKSLPETKHHYPFLVFRREEEPSLLKLTKKYFVSEEKMTALYEWHRAMRVKKAAMDEAEVLSAETRNPDTVNARKKRRL